MKERDKITIKRYKVIANASVHYIQLKFCRIQMDNLINFDDESAAETTKIIDERPNSPLVPLIPISTNDRKLVPQRVSVDLSNPYEKAEFQANNAGDPFECLEFLTNKQDSGNNSSLHLQDGSL